jgi:hypothetical protein
VHRQHQALGRQDDQVEGQEGEPRRRRLLPDKVDDDAPVEVAARRLAGFGQAEEDVRKNAEDARDEDGVDVRVLGG